MSCDLIWVRFEGALQGGKVVKYRGIANFLLVSILALGIGRADAGPVRNGTGVDANHFESETLRPLMRAAQIGNFAEVVARSTIFLRNPRTIDAYEERHQAVIYFLIFRSLYEVFEDSDDNVDRFSKSKLLSEFKAAVNRSEDIRTWSAAISYLNLIKSRLGAGYFDHLDMSAINHSQFNYYFEIMNAFRRGGNANPNEIFNRCLEISDEYYKLDCIHELLREETIRGNKIFAKESFFENLPDTSISRTFFLRNSVFLSFIKLFNRPDLLKNETARRFYESESSNAVISGFYYLYCLELCANLPSQDVEDYFLRATEIISSAPTTIRYGSEYQRVGSLIGGWRILNEKRK